MRSILSFCLTFIVGLSAVAAAPYNHDDALATEAGQVLRMDACADYEPGMTRLAGIPGSREAALPAGAPVVGMGQVPAVELAFPVAHGGLVAADAGVDEAVEDLSDKIGAGGLAEVAGVHARIDEPSVLPQLFHGREGRRYDGAGQGQGWY